MLKYYCLIILLLLTLAAANIFAQDRTLGAGLKFGEPTGVTVKYWLNQRNAFDFTLGLSLFNKNSNANINVNYLYHYYNVIKTKEDINLFLGFGARLVTKKAGDSSFGIRGIGGTAWDLRQYPVEIFIEAAPVFRLFPTTGLDFDMSVGARYYFK